MLIRWSRARRTYSCHRCRTTIAKGMEYGRDEPFPMARYAGLTAKHLCAIYLIPYLKELRITLDLSPFLRQPVNLNPA
jgi:hypothetical protein